MRIEQVDELDASAWLYWVLDDALARSELLVALDHEGQYRVHVERHILPMAYPTREEAVAAGMRYLAGDE